MEISKEVEKHGGTTKFPGKGNENNNLKKNNININFIFFSLFLPDPKTVFLFSLVISSQK